MIMKWDEKARETGAKIVSLCGHDCIPWDITVYKLTQKLKEECNDPIKGVRIYDDIKGGISGGTIDTMMMGFNGEYKAPRFEFDPYYKKRDGSKSGSRVTNACSNVIRKSHKGDLGDANKWTTPFVMSMVNAELIKRSHVLNENVKDGQIITYKESAVQPDFKTAFMTFFGLAGGLTAMLNPLTAKMIQKMLPPGQGPNEKKLKYGYLLVSGVGEGVNGSKVETEFYFPNDPGYKDTARMVTEAGLCLALDSEKLPVQEGGFYTPSSGMGDALLDRLCMTGSKFASRVVKLQSKL